jgi:hypothetical protein
MMEKTMATKKRTNSRAKGARVELEASKFLTSLGFPARRGQQFCGGPGSPDVVCETLDDVHVEVKGDESIDLGTKALADACKQAIADAGTHEWAVLWKKNRTKWRLTYQGDHPFVLVTVATDDEIRTALKWLNGDAA